MSTTIVAVDLRKRYGAGKTTTLEIIEGLRRAGSGEISLFGRSPWPRNRHCCLRSACSFRPRPPSSV